ncbi:MAG TPA: RNA methyltransferase [Pyrinomonadaceae bacterium]|nr:RNA methyltransferase [Pyrinomonadaceae bacterium]
MITSRQNPLVQHARAVGKGLAKDSIFIEGLRLCEEAARSDLTLEEVFHTENFAEDERAAALLKSLSRTGARPTVVSEQVFASLGDTKTPQGVVVLARRPPTDRATFEKSFRPDPLVVILHCINNPANAGAMLRVAEAAGATGIIATAGSTDLLSPKALRGAMGSSFRLPLWTNAGYDEALDWCGARGISTVSTDLAAARAHTDMDWTQARAVVMGAEAGGLTPAEVEAADERIRIPMRPPVESLNVAVALAVVLYEAARQREHVGKEES